MRAATYVRDVDVTRDLPYSEKYAEFLQLCEGAADSGFEAVVVAFPQVLGDTYEELVRNLDECAKAGLLVGVARNAT